MRGLAAVAAGRKGPVVGTVVEGFVEAVKGSTLDDLGAAV
jgi:hypothetical protein